MSDATPGRKRSGCTRRRFLVDCSVTVGATLAGGLAWSRSAHAGGSDMLRVGLIGCGGRGSGAAVNALNADKNARLVAMADVFDWRISESLKDLQTIKPDQVEVDARSSVRRSGVVPAAAGQ